ncbi:type II toxin-antitoxin system RelE/ParE family toxin [Nitrosovibrio sp. Nv17]|jgi:mRNA interferase RelE/StbE|uniref:type II toxin-antitoxin system RelE family toxin n=1 Tax=Nitrosovibrio sp. Nv17 TaxID=1855339 RepID=UPI0009091CD5|nr:type II toxin-antitoxin system RelE/ParE family toxin [Nitrosovibrio sp. Nv17]SFW39591.1 mRNA interferase RelE/StbE [Nitrosovibrio sp. Nv17]
MFRVEYTREAFKVLRSLPRNMAATIRGKIGQLASDPHRPNPHVRKLEGRPGFRLRVGDWRVIYEIDGDRLVIIVLAVGSRGGIYK